MAVVGHLPPEYKSEETLILHTFLSHLFSLSVFTVHHVPHIAKLLLAFALSREFSFCVCHGLWGFVRLLMFPKLVLRSPSCSGHKKCLSIGALLQDRLNNWISGDGFPGLWQATCDEEVKSSGA